MVRRLVGLTPTNYNVIHTGATRLPSLEEFARSFLRRFMQLFLKLGISSPCRGWVPLINHPSLRISKGLMFLSRREGERGGTKQRVKAAATTRRG